MRSDEPIITEKGVLTLSDAAWAEAKRRSLVITPLAQMSRVGHETADNAARMLGLSRRQIYELIRCVRQGAGLMTNLAPSRSHGGRGKSRLPSAVEGIISEVLQQLYLNRQKYSKSAIYREVALRCRQAGLHPPARNTILSRIYRMDPITVTRRREGGDSARSLQSAAGVPPQPATPLELVQMDHTKIDLVVVEETSREPVGRPYLTVAIDVFSRSIPGMVVTLEAPSATSVGLCLAHAVMDKQQWIERLGLEAEVSWPMHGKPETLHLDNAPEFKSEALRRGCDQHGIRLQYRPARQPHYGGVVERVIGAMMTMVHELPGTTFSNPVSRRKYDSEAKAVLTVRELEKWLALAVSMYHGSVHGTLRQTPEACWDEGIEHLKSIPTVTNAKAFLVDFLPVVRRSISRTGFRIDHITYYADLLKPWIARRKQMDKFIIRRDPRDLSRVWVLDPDTNRYFEIPYRTMANPAVTLWEHRKAVEKIRERGQAQIDEAALFRMITRMRAITQSAAKARKRARREQERRRHLQSVPPLDAPQPPTVTSLAQIQPFSEIEEW